MDKEKLRIGVRFQSENKEGVILQSCGNLPKHHNREDEKGPFYGVHYEGGKYTWYSEEQLLEVLKKSKIQNNIV
jgi:hypothetical protein